MTQLPISSIGDVIELAADSEVYWFRGTCREWNDLTPKLLRPECRPVNSDQGLLLKYEVRCIELFEREAVLVARNAPARDDDLAWLSLMQHYQLPTRLLDWTRSPLVALYFAVENPSEDDGKFYDGEFWAMNWRELNKKSGFDGFPRPRNQNVKYLAAASMDLGELAKDLRLIGKVPEYPLAVLPPVNTLRAFAQKGAFTLHPRSGNTNLADLLEPDRELVRCVVPCDRKQDLRRELAVCGIRRKFDLFPDLNELAQDVKDRLTPPFQSACGKHA